MIGSNQSKQEVDLAWGVVCPKPWIVLASLLLCCHPPPSPKIGSIGSQEVSPFLGVVSQMCTLPLILSAATLTFLPQWADWVKP